MATKLTKNVSPEHYFRLTNGDSIKNVKELVRALRGMDDSTFMHHVNSEKNDFAKKSKKEIFYFFI